MAKRTKTSNPQLTKDLNAFILQFYMTLYKRKPDATHYALGQRVVRPLLEAQDGIEAHTYTTSHLMALAVFLHSRGVVVDLFCYTRHDLLRAFADRDWNKVDAIVERMLQQQADKGIYTENQINAMKPSGW